jgi:hypothetical protein
VFNLIVGTFSHDIIPPERLGKLCAIGQAYYRPRLILGAGQVAVSQTRSSSLRTRVWDVVTRAAQIGTHNPPLPQECSLAWGRLCLCVCKAHSKTGTTVAGGSDEALAAGAVKRDTPWADDSSDLICAAAGSPRVTPSALSVARSSLPLTGKPEAT